MADESRALMAAFYSHHFSCVELLLPQFSGALFAADLASLELLDHKKGALKWRPLFAAMPSSGCFRNPRQQSAPNPAARFFDERPSRLGRSTHLFAQIGKGLATLENDSNEVALLRASLIAKRLAICSFTSPLLRAGWILSWFCMKKNGRGGAADA